MQIEVGKTYVDGWGSLTEIIVKIKPTLGRGEFVGLHNNGCNYFMAIQYNENGTATGDPASHREYNIIEEYNEKNSSRFKDEKPEFPGRKVKRASVDSTMYTASQLVLEYHDEAVMSFSAADTAEKKADWADKYAVPLLASAKILNGIVEPDDDHSDRPRDEQ